MTHEPQHLHLSTLFSADPGVAASRKATGSLKLFHDKYNQKTHFAQHQAYVDEFDEAMLYNEQIKPHVNKVPAPALYLQAQLH